MSRRERERDLDSHGERKSYPSFIAIPGKLYFNDEHFTQVFFLMFLSMIFNDKKLYNSVLF